MPTKIVESMTTSVTIATPTITGTECALPNVDLCTSKGLTLPKPQHWSLAGWCIVIIPSLIISCSFLNNHFSVGVPGNENAEMGVERLCKWTTSSSCGAKEQRSSKDREGKGVTKALGNTIGLGC